MPGDHRKRRPPQGRPTQGSPFTAETFAPLAAASRGEPIGRVQSLDDARRELRIPNSADPQVLQLWGTPRDFELVAYPVDDAARSGTVAEFAVLRIVTRKENKLVPRDARIRLRPQEKRNALWIVYGTIATATDGALVLETLAIGPAFEGRLSREGDDFAHGITGPLLRLISPTRILAACAEQLQIKGYWLDVAASTGAKPMPTKQRELLARIDQGRRRQARIPDDQIAEIAKRYLVLYHRGNRRPRAQLAREFGITPTQARDRLHQARERGYLTKGTPGRAGAQPGPVLTALGWTPPELTSHSPVVNTDNEQGSPRKRKPKGKA